MRSWIALAVAVTTLTSSVTEAGVFSGVCKPSVDPQLEQISELLETIATEEEAPFELDPRVVVVEISTPSYAGAREIGQPSGESKTTLACWLPFVTDDENVAPRPIFAIHRFEPYHKARAFHAEAMDVVHKNISAPLGRRYASLTVVRPKWRSSWNANNATGLLDVAAESMHGTALIIATGGIGIAYQNVKLAEDYWSTPLDAGQGASELVEGTRTGDFDRGLAGYTQASSAVMTAGAVTVPLAKGLRAATPPARYLHNVTVVDRYTKSSFTGTIDLKPTLDRIKSGGAYPHVNDGSVFRNTPLKGKTTPELPAKPLGYYREYVHPTAGFSGPGPQRIVVGQGGEMHYTPDHYKTFIQIK